MDKKTQHTPGKWRLYDPPDLREEGQGCWLIVGSDNQQVCIMEDRPTISMNDHIAEANARLIAAAPDLLDALEGLLLPALGLSRSRTALVDDFGELGLYHIEKARSAIARARGEEVK